MPELSVLLPLIVMLLAIGALAGLLAGLLGVGGGIVLVPAFFYAFAALGYDSPQLMQICLGTSLATIIVTSIRSVLSHHKKGAVDWDILKGWGIGIVVGAVIGVLVATQLRSIVLQAVFGGMGLCIGLYMLYGLPIHRAVATASGFGVIIAVPAVIGFLFADIDVAPPLTVGAVNLGAFVIIIAMTLVTTPWGAAIAHKMDPKPLKKVFGFFLILVALNMLRKVLFG